ncbi:MAG: DUF484 family protein [Pseudomonadales bacterium]|nr:DUF484 family protein [Pseudomonadales bacterium]
MKAAETDTLDDSLDDSQVAAWLATHPDFFRVHGELLTSLTIPHESGSAISLLEHQINLLRDKNRDLQHKVDNFLANAKANARLFEKTRLMILEFLKASSMDELNKVVDLTISREFGSTRTRLLFTAGTARTEGGQDMDEQEAREILGPLFEKQRTFCGELNEAQARLLFPEEASKIVSAAIISIHSTTAPDTEAKATPSALLVIGSEKTRHFNSEQDTLFLDFIGEVIAALISRMA